MKYIIYLLAAMYIIWWIYVINVFFLGSENEKLVNIEEIKKSIVVIVPEQEIISYENNPKWLFEKYKSSWIWAGFFISNDWKIQTVNHILWKNNSVIYNWKEYKSEIISQNKKTDLAVIKINAVNKVILTPWKTNKNIIYSFWINPRNLKIIYNTWTIINQKNKLENISNLLQISNTLKPGFSWWPIINSNWKVVWINYAISEWKNYWINLFNF